MTADYSDETLMAFADGLLDEPLFSAVAEALEHDATLAERLEKLVDGAALARKGFEPLLQPVSPELEASVRAMIARKGQKAWRVPRFDLNWLLPLAGAAAAIAAVAVAVPMFQPPAIGILGGIGEAELQAALDTVPSGKDHVLGGGRALHAVASFTDASGNLCREFEAEGFVMVACRNEGQWQIQMAVATGTGEGYQTASGLAVLDAYLGEIGAGAPLSIDEESAALAGDR